MDTFLSFSWWRNMDTREVFLTSTLAVSVTLMVFFYKLKGMRKENQDRRLPPGPRPWPIVGNLWLLGDLQHQDFAKLAKQYGPIFHLRLGSASSVVVSSPKIAEEILKTKDHIFASRPLYAQGEIMGYNSQTVGTSSYGPYWRHARKVFTLELLTIKRLEQFQRLRKLEVLVTLHSILEDCKLGKPVRLDLRFGQLSKNNITQMMIKKSFFGPNSSASNLKEETGYGGTIKELVRLYSVFELGDYIPFLHNFDLQGYKKQMREVQRENDTFFDKIIDEHRRMLCSKTSEELSKRDMMDLVDVLLTRPTGADNKPLTDPQIKAILLGVLVAGTETSSLTMEWAMTELLKSPAALKKVQEELDSVVGRNRPVEESDVPHLKYLRDVVKETLRLHPVAPMLVPHCSMESCEVAGYLIPANCQVFVNIWAMGRDASIWERPLEFEPERFQRNNIDFIGQDFELLPFGSGRRSCPGRNMGLLVVEYTLALLLHACSWELPPGLRPEDVDLSEAPGLVVQKAVPLEAVARARLPVHVIYGAPESPVQCT